MVKLNDLANVDLNLSHVLVGGLCGGIGALADRYYLTVYKPRKEEERKQDAEKLARMIAPYIAEEVKGKVPQSEAYAVTSELVQVLKEVKDVLKEYRAK